MSIHRLAMIAGLSVGLAGVGGFAEPYDGGAPSPRKGRMPLQLPSASAGHFTSDKPLSKRAKRRQRGKVKP